MPKKKTHRPNPLVRRPKHLKHTLDQRQLAAQIPGVEQRPPPRPCSSSPQPPGRVPHDLGSHAPRRPQIHLAPVPRAPEQQLRRAVARRAHLEVLLLGRLAARIAGAPGRAEVGEVGWAAGGGEQDVGGLDVAVDYALRMEVGEGCEEGVEDWAGGGGGEGGG